MLYCGGMVEKREKHGENSSGLDFKDLEFEEVLEGLLEIKPVENKDLKDKPKPKKKSTPKKK